MPLELPDIFTRLKADAAGLEQGFNRGRAAAKSYKSDVDKTIGSIGKQSDKDFNAFIAKVDRDLDALDRKHAAAAQSSRAVGIAVGAVIATAVAGEMVHAAKKAEALVEQFAQGKLSVEGMRDEFVRSIPVLGQLADAGSRFINIVSGNAYYIAQVKAATEAQERHVAVVRQLREASAAYRREADAAIESARRETTEAKLGGGLRRDLFRAGQEELKRYGDAMARSGEHTKTLNAAIVKMQDAQRILSSFQGRFSDTPSAPLAESVTKWQQNVDAAKRTVDAIRADAPKLQEELNAIGENAFFKKGQAIFDAAGTAAKNWFQPFVDAAEKAKQARERATGELDALRQEVERFGLTDMQNKVLDFKAMPGVTKQQIDDFERLIGKLQELRVDKALDDFFSGVAGEAEPAAEKVRRKIEQSNLPGFCGGSADAERLRFSLARGQDQIPQKQLNVQEDIRDVLGEMRDQLDIPVTEIA